MNPISFYVTYEMKIRKIKTLAPGDDIVLCDEERGIHSVSIIIKKHDTDEITDAKKRKPE